MPRHIERPFPVGGDPRLGIPKKDGTLPGNLTIDIRLARLAERNVDWGTTPQNWVEASLTQLQRHPFIRAAHASTPEQTLTPTQTQRWVMSAGRESRTFPRILEGMLQTETNPTIRGVLQENLNDELGIDANGQQHPERAHFQHYMQLLDKLGVSREAFEGYQEGPNIRFALDLANAIGESGDSSLSLGYMLVNEAMTPVTYSAAGNGFAGLVDEPGRLANLREGFVDEHVSVDEVHVAQLYTAIDAMKLSATHRERLFVGVQLGLLGMEAVLDEAYGKPHKIFK